MLEEKGVPETRKLLKEQTYDWEAIKDEETSYYLTREDNFD